MRKGVVYPQIELGGDVGAVRAFAQAAEDLGYDHFLMYDHVLGAEHAGASRRCGGRIRRRTRSTNHSFLSPTWRALRAVWSL